MALSPCPPSSVPVPVCIDPYLIVDIPRLSVSAQLFTERELDN